MLLINEWRYLMRQPLLWLACIILPGVAYLFAEGIGSTETLADKHLQSLHITMLMMCLPLLIGALAPIVFLRDQANDMAELVLVTPQSTIKRLFNRLLIVFLVCALLILLSFMIMWLILSQTYGFQKSLLTLALWDFTLMAVPACAFYCALACCLARRFASSVVIYSTFCSAWLIYIMLASMTGSPMLAGSTITSPWLFESMRLLDPFGNTALIALYQQPEIGLYGDAVFYLNRLFYCVLAVALFFASLTLTPYSRKHLSAHGDAELNTTSSKAYQFVAASPKASNQLLHLSFLSLSTLLKQRLSQLILVGWGLLMMNEILSGIDYAEPLQVLKPTSLDALNRISDDVLPLLGSLLVMFWSWQLCWRNKQTAMAELIAAAPVRSGVMLSSQVLALGTLILLLMLLTSLGGVVAQTLAHSEIQLGQYLTQLSKAALSMFLLGAIFTAFHNIFRSPLVAVACCILVLVMKFSPISGALGLTHTLWNIAASPLQPADAFWGSQQSLSVYWPFMTFWLLCTFSLIYLAIQWSHRSASFISHRRWKLTISSSALLALSLWAGLHLHANIIDERPLISSDMREQWRVDYEQQYSSWAAVTQPVISHVDAKVAIFPLKGDAEFSLIYTLENRSKQAIDSLLIGHDSATPLDSLSLSVEHSYDYDQQLGQYKITLATAIKPGETLQVSSRLIFKQPQHWPAVMHQMVKPTFSYLRGSPLLPTIGFQPQYRLRNDALRQEYGLAALDLANPSTLFAKSRAHSAKYDWASIHSVVSTNDQQLPLAQGTLIKQWQQNGRNFAEYQSKGPIRNAFVWYSVPKNSLKAQSGSTVLEVFSPAKTQAAKLNLQAMEDTLNWMSTYIAPYLGDKLNLIAIPNIGPTGYALPQMIMINHKVGFRAEPAPKAGFDQRYRRAVHETAHQWFGHDLGNGVLEDSAFLVESLAKYVELVMIEQRYGIEAMQALIEYERQRYKVAVMRSPIKTASMVDATENYDLYSRATLVFAILRQQLGDDRITQALRSLWQQHAYPLTPATSMDFVRVLKAQLNVEQQALVDSLLLGTDNKILLDERPE